MRAPRLSPVEQARKDLAWLEEVGALRKVELDGDGFIVTTRPGNLFALGVDQVATFRAGVLTGWRLPRSGQVLG